MFFGLIIFNLLHEDKVKTDFSGLYQFRTSEPPRIENWRHSPSGWSVFNVRIFYSYQTWISLASVYVHPVSSFHTPLKKLVLSSWYVGILVKKTWLHFIFMVDINKQRVKLSYRKYNQKILVLFVSIADYITSYNKLLFLRKTICDYTSHQKHARSFVQCSRDDAIMYFRA